MFARLCEREADSLRDGHMLLRWTAAGMLNANCSFRRIEAMSRLSNSSRRCTSESNSCGNPLIGMLAKASR